MLIDIKNNESINEFKTIIDDFEKIIIDELKSNNNSGIIIGSKGDHYDGDYNEVDFKLSETDLLEIISRIKELLLNYKNNIISEEELDKSFGLINFLDYVDENKKSYCDEVWDCKIIDEAGFSYYYSLFKEKIREFFFKEKIKLINIGTDENIDTILRITKKLENAKNEVNDDFKLILDRSIDLNNLKVQKYIECEIPSFRYYSKLSDKLNLFNDLDMIFGECFKNSELILKHFPGFDLNIEDLKVLYRIFFGKEINLNKIYIKDELYNEIIVNGKDINNLNIKDSNLLEYAYSLQKMKDTLLSKVDDIKDIIDYYILNFNNFDELTTKLEEQFEQKIDYLISRKLGLNFELKEENSVGNIYINGNVIGNFEYSKVDNKFTKIIFNKDELLNLLCSVCKNNNFINQFR